jgi:hypothetical protein
MAGLFAVLAVPPLFAALLGAADPTFRPGNFPIEAMASAALVLISTAALWLLHDPGRRRPVAWLIVGGGLLGLLLGAYGIWGTSVLLGDCGLIESLAMVAASIPQGYCESDSHDRALTIGYYMIGVGVASAISLVAVWWLGRDGRIAALD